MKVWVSSGLPQGLVDKALRLLGGGRHYPTIEPPELTKDWETDSWQAQTEPCVHQDPGERSSDPTRD